MLIISVLVLLIFALISLNLFAESNGEPGALFVPMGIGIFIVAVLWLGYWFGVSSVTSVVG